MSSFHRNVKDRDIPSVFIHVRTRVCVCVCVCVCERARAHTRVCVCLRARVCVVGWVGELIERRVDGVGGGGGGGGGGGEKREDGWGRWDGLVWSRGGGGLGGTREWNRQPSSLWAKSECSELSSLPVLPRQLLVA